MNGRADWWPAVLGYRSDRSLSLAGRAMRQLEPVILKEMVQSGAWTATWTNSVELRLHSSVSVSKRIFENTGGG